MVKKKKVIMVKKEEKKEKNRKQQQQQQKKTTVYKKKSWLIVIDLCQSHYQIFLITYVKLTKKNAKLVWKEKKILLRKKMLQANKWGNQKFPNTNKFCKDDLNKFFCC